jgi:hypothetical protein
MAADARRCTRIKVSAVRIWFGLAVIGALNAAPTPQINDPEAFVRDIYKRFAASQAGSGDYTPPADFYSPRLKALFVRDEKWAKGEVGCLDFDFWVNGQDYQLKNVRVSSRPVADHPDRILVIATFLNLGTMNEIHFDFQRIAGKWLLDDVQSVRGERWTLSKILACPH